MDDPRRKLIVGPAVPLRGNDIDTDRIIPARFLKTVTFDGLGDHVFEDDRAALRASDRAHPLDDPRFSGARILLVDANFGCGSSREHAPQALVRWGRGIEAVVGASFAEIFAGNCLAIGLPCPTLAPSDLSELMADVEADPTLELRVDIDALALEAGARRFALSLPEGTRQQLLSGRWDSTFELLEAEESIERVAERLPYWGGWR